MKVWMKSRTDERAAVVLAKPAEGGGGLWFSLSLAAFFLVAAEP